MKIAYLYVSMAAYGGMERIFSDKMNYLAEVFGYEVYFITSDQEGFDYSFQLSPKIKHIDLRGVKYMSIYRYKYPLRLWQWHKFSCDFKKRLQDTLLEIKPDILVDTIGAYTSIVADIPFKGIKVLESHLSKIYTLKANKEKDGFFLFQLKRLFDESICRKIRKYDKMVVLTQKDQKDWSDIRDSFLIPNLVTYYPESIHKTASKKIVCAGRLYPQKGFDLLIMAWSLIAAKFPEWSIQVYGDGDKTQLEKMASDYSVSRSLTFHKSISTIYDKLMEAEIFVLPSRYEGFGLVLVEAMSCATPCVAFNCPSGPGEIITHTKDGLLVEPENIEELASKIEWMILHKEERVRMGGAARESVKKYKKENVMLQWKLYFEQCL